MPPRKRKAAEEAQVEENLDDIEVPALPDPMPPIDSPEEDMGALALFSLILALNTVDTAITHHRCRFMPQRHRITVQRTRICMKISPEG